MTALSHHEAQPGQAAGCPVDHSAFSQQKTARVTETAEPAIVCDAEGVWQVRGFREARALLRNAAATKQAGFNADLIEHIPGATNQPILYQEGKVHQQQRKQTARFFAPKVVDEHYRQVMEALVDQLIAPLQRTKQADLSKMSRTLAVRVAAEVVGLTASDLRGMERRLDAFFAGSVTTFSWRPGALRQFILGQTRTAAFFLRDVKPAIRARRKAPQEDIISHLIAHDYKDTEILTECLTYGAAGMATTREFICVSAWHLLEEPELRARYLAGNQDERYQILHEILRLEPVVGHLYRRATMAITLESAGQTYTIPTGALIDIHIHGANVDPAIVGDKPFMLEPERELHAENAAQAMMSFGDGHHRCPGSFIAIQETDIFLRRLLPLPGLRMERLPALAWNDLVTGYEIRDFQIAVA
jgi:cytochrome P450